MTKKRRSKKFVVTGAAGFIGAAVSRALCARGDTVVGVDNLNDYYDPRLKEARLETLRREEGFTFTRLDIADQAAVGALFAQHRPETVVHLAAQTGVRYSMEKPHVYATSNLVGFTNILEGCRHAAVSHLVYASSSSVYGANRKLPFSTDQTVDHPLSFYGATKKANELMAHSYSHLYGIPTTGLRFFTVYGPWGRPDMALFLFSRNIMAGRPVEVYNYGRHRRDFTFIDDVVEGVVRVADEPPVPCAASNARYAIYNLGNNTPVWLEDVITELEEALGRKAEKRMAPAQPSDLLDTYADVADFERTFGFHPRTSLRDGVASFARWYLDYYGPSRKAKRHYGKEGAPWKILETPQINEWGGP